MTPAAPSEELPLAPDSADASESPRLTGGQPANAPFVTATHEMLFAENDTRCDACGGPLDSPAPTDGLDGEDDSGSGLYVWARNGEVVYEEPPLCAACAAAITLTAMQRWEIEEEEG